MSNLRHTNPIRPVRSALGCRGSALGLLVCAPLWLGCSAGNSDGTGGQPGTGGAGSGTAGTGITAGTTSATAGTTATTAGTSSGGATSGGTASSGTSSGGSAMAGAAHGDAGNAMGGSAQAGQAAGGASGGSSAAGSSSGGAHAGSGSGGSSTGGSGGTMKGGSMGCTAATPLKGGNLTESVDGKTRNYTLDVPTGYQADKPYRLIFVWHPLGGSASQVVSGGYNGLKSLSNGSAILVAPDGQDGSNSEASGHGWWNVNGSDMKFLTAMLAKITGGLCVDQDRIFSTGFSFGGMMSYTVGYEFDVFRAIAPCSGDLQVIPHEEKNTAPLPIMAFHGDNDTFVTTARGRAARDKYLARNKCGTQTMSVSPSPCVQYQGCAVPTFWCEFPGGHMPWSEEPQAIWKFLSQF